MGLTVLPYKDPASIGQAKSDDPAIPITDLSVQQPAAEIERLKTALIDVCTEVGLHDGSTPLSLGARVGALEAMNLADHDDRIADIEAFETLTNAGEIGGVVVDLTGIADGDLLGFVAGSPDKIKKVTPSGGGSTLLAVWDETGVSQWQLGLDQVGGGTAAVISYQANARGPRMRVAFPAKAGTNVPTIVTWHGIDLSVLADKGSGRFRYVWEFDLVKFSNDNGSDNSGWYSIGPAFACNDVTTGFYGLSVGASVGAATRGVHVKSDTVSLSGGTPNWPQLFDRGNGRDMCQSFRCTVEIVKVGGSAPVFLVTNELIMPGSGTARVVAASQDSWWNDIVAFSTSWNAVTPVTVGICILAQASGTTADQYFEFENMRISKHPMDL